MFESLNIPEEAKSKEFKEIENRFFNKCEASGETFTEEKTAPATGEILINKAEFDAAMKKVAEDVTNDPKVEGMAKLIMPLTGMTFACKMADILFPENKEV